MATEITMEDLLGATIEYGASDLHVRANMPPELRVHGELQPSADEVLTPEDTYALCRQICSEEQLADADYMALELYNLANDDFHFNTVRSLPYQHEHAPIIMEALHDIDERGDSTRWDMPLVGKLDKRWDDAFVGTIEGNTDCPVAVYEFGLFVKAVMAEMGVDAKFGKKLAKKYLDEGINGDKPAILYGFKVDADRWDELRKDINDEMMEAFFNA